MRVTQSLNQAQFLAALNQLESNLSQTHNQISTNLAFTTPSQNPVAAGSVNNYDQALAQSQQYDSNANSAQTRLSIEDTALAHLQTALQTLRGLALQANNGTVSSQGRAAIAAQATQIQNGLLSLANTQDGNGEYIFAGFSTNNQPFTLTPSGANYAGDQGQRQVQIAAGQTIADGDNGNGVFNQIKTGNGTFSASAAAGNTGTGVLGASTVQNPAAYDGGTYAINFTAANTYEVRDSANALVTSGTYTDGQSVAFRGVQVTLNGQPATGDSFTVAPSSNQSIFTTVQNLVTALTTGTGASTSSAQAKVNNSMGTAINNIDQALAQTSNIRATVGARLNTITTQQSVSSSQQIQLKASISSLQSLDYAAAITTLTLQNTTLTASMQAYTLTQGLTLFKYI
jgi:flagellar hook-associated protein 3 FlgL